MKLNYKIIGSGRPAIILHGLFGMGDNWVSFAKKMSEDSFQMILVDLRNHGHSPWSNDFSYSVMAADIAELILELQLENAVVIGHSMGGKVAMRLINDYPNVIAKAIIVDIAPSSYPVKHRNILDAMLAVDLEKIKSRGEAEKILMNSIEEVSTRQFLLKNLYWIESEKLSWRFNLEVLNKTIDEIGEPVFPRTVVNIPILFVKGENSGYIDSSRFAEIKECYPEAKFITIKNAGHWVHADQPQALLESVLLFLD